MASAEGGERLAMIAEMFIGALMLAAPIQLPQEAPAIPREQAVLNAEVVIHQPRLKRKGSKSKAKIFY